MTYDVGNPTNLVYYNFERSLSLLKKVTDSLEGIHNKYGPGDTDIIKLIEKSRDFIENYSE